MDEERPMAVAERYRRAPRVEPCACGGTITSEGGSDGEITAAVRAHQRTARHRAWWRAQEDQR